MSNEFAVSSLIARNMGEYFMQYSPIFNTGNIVYLPTFTQQEYATGGVVNIKIPGYPLVTRGLAVTAQAIEDLIIPYTITPDDIYNVPRALTVFDELLKIVGKGGALTKDQKAAIVDNYAMPAYTSLEGALESESALRLQKAAYLTPIDTVDKLGSINTFSMINKVTTMANALKFQKSRVMMMNLQDAGAVSDSLQNMFNTAINTRITKEALVGGPDKGRLAGLDLYQCADIKKHEAGVSAGRSGMTISSISSDGSQITIAGVESSTSVLVKAGDRISIPSVYLVDPVNKNAIPYKLVVKAASDANGNGSGSVTVTLSYPLMASGEHANVASLPANGAPVYIFGNHNNNYCYVPSGLSIVPLELPDIRGAENSSVKADQTKRVPFKVMIQGLVSSGENIFRISGFVGIKALPPYIIELPSKAD